MSIKNILSILFFLIFVSQNVFAQSVCEDVFKPRESIWIRATLKAPEVSKPTKYGGLFTYEPRIASTGWWSKIKNAYQYGPRKIAKLILKNEDYRFTPLELPNNIFRYIPSIIDKYTGQLLVEKLSQRYLGVKKHLRAWLSIPLYGLVMFYPTEYVMGKIETSVHTIEVKADAQYAEKLEANRDAHFERINYDFRFVDLKIKMENTKQQAHSASEVLASEIEMLKAANERAAQVQQYQQIRDQLEPTMSLSEQSDYLLQSPLFNQVRYYVLLQQEKHQQVSQQKIDQLVQLTNHYLISLEVVDAYVEMPVLYQAQKRIALKEGNKTILEITEEIENHEFIKDTLTVYYNWGVLPKAQYHHYLQAFYYYRYQMSFAEANGVFDLKDKSKPATPDNIRTHDDILQMLAMQLFKNNPQVVARIKQERLKGQN